MTQEGKQLLLKDLCMRLPYGVKIKVRSNDTRTVRAVDVVEGIVHFVEPDSISPYGVHIEHPTTFHQVAKPYLRPMSSMTKDERNEYMDITHAQIWLIIGNLDKATDWLNAHHFDYRVDPSTGKTLIESGLALEAPEGMYNLEGMYD